LPQRILDVSKETIYFSVERSFDVVYERRPVMTTASF